MDSPDASPRTYIVATQGGVVEVDLHGRILKRISQEPASHIWLLGGERYLTLAQEKLRIIDAETGSELSSTKIPNIATCKSTPLDSNEYYLFYQSALPAIIASKGGAIRLTLADRDYDAGFEVDVTVCLGTGKIYGEEQGDCRVPGMETGPAPCAGLFDSSDELQIDIEPPPPAPHDFEYDLDAEGRITKGSRQERKPIGGPLFALDRERFSIESTSKSGRWVLMNGPEFDASNYYHLHLLLDRKLGYLYPLAITGTEFPEFISQSEWDSAFVEGEGGGPGGPKSWISYNTDIVWVEGVSNVLRVGSLVMHLDTQSVADLGGLPAF